jgi:hypothetical protein
MQNSHEAGKCRCRCGAVSRDEVFELASNKDGARKGAVDQLLEGFSEPMQPAPAHAAPG